MYSGSFACGGPKRPGIQTQDLRGRFQAILSSGTTASCPVGLYRKITNPLMLPEAVSCAEPVSGVGAPALCAISEAPPASVCVTEEAWMIVPLRGTADRTAAAAERFHRDRGIGASRALAAAGVHQHEGGLPAVATARPGRRRSRRRCRHWSVGNGGQRIARSQGRGADTEHADLAARRCIEFELLTFFGIVLPLLLRVVLAGA
jgi:hypothetical protein